MYDAFANSRPPLATIIDHLKVQRSGTHHPIFQVALNYRQDNPTRSSFGDVPIEWLDGTNLGYPYDMKFDVNDTHKVLPCDLEISLWRLRRKENGAMIPSNIDRIPV